MQEKQEMEKTIGRLIVITGASGTGKDSVKDKVIEHPDFIALNVKNVVTCTDRLRRIDSNPPERPDAYHFKSRKELDLMAKRGELVEEITDTDLSRKATPKLEIDRLLAGENLIWRIDPSRAADVATGEFFDRIYPDCAEILKSNTLVICINTSREIVEKRRKGRDKEKYNPEDYQKRDEEEAPHLRVLLEKAIVIENPDGMLEETVLQTLSIIKTHHAKK